MSRLSKFIRQWRVEKSYPRRLNLGCGHDYRPGYLNVDLNDWHRTDMLADITNMPELPSGYFEEIVAQDVLEHFERAKTKDILTEWTRLLQDGGTLFLRVPSLVHLLGMLNSPHWQSLEQQAEIVHLLYGTQAYPGDYHLTGFTAELLDHQLREAGLRIYRSEILHGWLFEVYARKTSDSLHYALKNSVTTTSPAVPAPPAELVAELLPAAPLPPLP